MIILEKLKYQGKKEFNITFSFYTIYTSQYLMKFNQKQSLSTEIIDKIELP